MPVANLAAVLETQARLSLAALVAREVGEAWREGGRLWSLAELVRSEAGRLGCEDEADAVLLAHGALLGAVQEEAIATGDRLAALLRDLGATTDEATAVFVAGLVEEDATLGAIVAELQGGTPGVRPTLGLVAHALCTAEPSRVPLTLHGLAFGAAARAGLLRVEASAAPLHTCAVSCPLPLWSALCGLRPPSWPGEVQDWELRDCPLPEGLLAEARRLARYLAGSEGRSLLVRGSEGSGRLAAAAAIARALGLRPLVVGVGPETLSGLGAFAVLDGRLPVLVVDLAPGEAAELPALRGSRGPLVVVAGLDGSLRGPALRDAVEWRPARPEPAERSGLWARAIAVEPGDELARDLGCRLRYTPGRLGQVGRLARRRAELGGREAVELSDVHEAAWDAEQDGLGTLARPMRYDIGSADLVLPERTRAALEELYERCLSRDQISLGLGQTLRARYHPGVRALLSGPSGTGKTLAAAWLASRLALPLYRVDLASVMNKYIGETEKNLASLFGRAEASDVLLLFDEADALFGGRVDVRDAHDHYVNVQTSYLLQRMETFDGIAVLTTNKQGRIDDAFTRRLDAVIELPFPSAAEREALWRAHLGEGHSLTEPQLRALARRCELAGGHIRNAVLSAAARRCARGADLVSYEDVLAGVEGEHTKQGRSTPEGLSGS